MKQVGHVAVDAGCVWIGDPCYVLPDDASNADQVRDWSSFCDKLDHQSDATQFRFNHGHIGLGVVVPSGWGDGMYPVYVTESNEGRVASVTVVFIEEDEEDV